jgi:hypothetical protein
LLPGASSFLSVLSCPYQCAGDQHLRHWRGQQAVDIAAQGQRHEAPPSPRSVISRESSSQSSRWVWVETSLSLLILWTLRKVLVSFSSPPKAFAQLTSPGPPTTTVFASVGRQQPKARKTGAVCKSVNDHQHASGCPGSGKRSLCPHWRESGAVGRSSFRNSWIPNNN